MGRETRPGQSAESPEEGEALLGVHEAKSRVVWRVPSQANRLQRLDLWQQGVTVGDCVAHSQPLVDSSIGVCRGPRHHSTPLPSALGPRPVWPWVETGIEQESPDALGIRSGEVAHFLPDSPCKHCVGRGG